MRRSRRCIKGVLVFCFVTILCLPVVAIAQEKPVRLTISGGTAGGAWSAATEGVAETLRKELPRGSAVSATTGTDSANFVRVHRKSADLAVGVSSTGLAALAGKEPYNKPMENIRAVTALFDEPFQFVILKKTGIQSFGDIKAKKYPLRHSPNKKGNFMEIACEAIFKKYGFDYKAIQGYGGKILFNSYGESINLIRSDSLDSLSGCSPVPTTQFVELSGTHDITILPLSDKVIGEMNKEYGTMKYVIPAKAYKFLKADVPTIGARNILVCRADLPEDLVYRITKAIYERRNYLGTVHVAMKNLNGAFMTSTGGVPLHPGAARFYREAGILK